MGWDRAHICGTGLGLRGWGWCLGGGCVYGVVLLWGSCQPTQRLPVPTCHFFLPRQTNVSTERLERYLGREDLDTSAIHHSPVAGR